MSRTEKDVLGEVTIEDDCYYGVNTYRARNNFRITGLTADSDHIVSYARIKLAAAVANNKGGKLPDDKKDLIVEACQKIIDGEYHDQFVIDVFQAGAGTSFHMNANEVIANIALELAGKKKGDYSFLHPNDQVNMSQSTNDTFPTMIRLTALIKARRLMEQLDKIVKSLEKKADQFKNVKKPGRTHLQDGPPLTLGIELSAWAYTLRKDLMELKQSFDYMRELNIGGTATGTGVNTAPGYQENVVKELSRLTGEEMIASENLPGIMEFMSDFSRMMNAAANIAIDVNKISNDVRLMYSGPGAGLHEIIIPAVQQGSSIMPGKINPSIAEAMNMICHSVLGSQQALNFSAQAGQFELNVMMPHIDYELNRSLDILANGLEMFRTKLVDGLEADTKRMTEMLSRSFGSAVLLNPYLGYDTVAKIVQEALHTGKSLKDLALATGKISEEDFIKVMSGNK
ncbi:aspartate ammonia-lyase [uncultured archaeon]|nr:aspartate ammonia-lyase [uncultured archaeon]